MTVRRWLSAAGLLAALSVAGCAETDISADAIAGRDGFERSIVEGSGFQHVAFVKPPRPGPDDILDIYLEGDGLPLDTAKRISADPTPHHALALELMSADPGPAAYLARPCYQGMEHDPGCSPALWTDARYGDAVVTSMAAAAKRLETSAGASRIRLVGYSGGGALAVLLAARLPEVTDVVTVAANLDLGAWAAWHHYAALTQSLDPAEAPALKASLRQTYLYAGKDDVVPASTAKAYLDREPGAATLVFPAFTHICCWVDVWPRIAAALRAATPLPCGDIGCESMRRFGA